jgi:hypothetical protein
MDKDTVSLTGEGVRKALITEIVKGHHEEEEVSFRLGYKSPSEDLSDLFKGRVYVQRSDLGGLNVGPVFHCHMSTKSSEKWNDQRLVETYWQLCDAGLAEMNSFLPFLGATGGGDPREVILYSDGDGSVKYGRVSIDEFGHDISLDINLEPFNEISDKRNKAAALKVIAGQLADFALYTGRTYMKIYRAETGPGLDIDGETDQKNLKFYGIEAKKS